MLARMSQGTAAGRIESAAPVRQGPQVPQTLRAARHELICTFPGSVADGATGPLLYPSYAATVLAVHACAKTAPSGVAAEVDVLINGTSIFPGSNPTIPAGSLVGASVTLAAVAWIPGDEIQCKVIESGGATVIVVEIDISR